MKRMPSAWLFISSELAFPISLPNKNEQVRTKTETNELNVAQSILLMLWSGVILYENLLVPYQI
jgi:hypothetical protein